MRMKTMVAIVAFGLVSAAAFAQDVKVDYDKAANFATMKTFASKIGTAWGNPLSEKRVQGEIDEALTAKGWAKAADEASADAVVVLHGASQQKHTLDTFYTGGAYRWRGWGGGTATTTVRDYTVGTLVVDIFDGKTKQLVFRGTATGEISDKPEKNIKKMEKVTDKMFKDFPPGSAKK